MSAPGIFRPPAAANEPVRSYVPGSPERAALRDALAAIASQTHELPLVIGGAEARTGRTVSQLVPHAHHRAIAEVHQGGAAEVERAIGAATAAWHDWSRTPWDDRAAVFLRAADLLAGPWRARLNAATMLGQSKTPHQAEIDAACELVDFWRFNTAYMAGIYAEQPLSPAGAWNRLEYRSLEGFVFAVTPFNFTSIAGNLPTSPALMGNVVVWKPATTAALSAQLILELLQEAGLPPGVINLVHGPGAEIGAAALASPELAGIHFTGSTPVFRSMWRTVGERIDGYRGYPRLVGETGGKDFVLVHASADLETAVTAIVRGGFEYQGQKCSAVSRVYVPRSRWAALRARLVEEVSAIRVGDVEDFEVFMGAVIDAKSFATQVAAIDEARTHPDTDVVVGGEADDSQGFFVRPTVVETRDPSFRLLRDELFGPVVTVFVYDDARWDEALRLVDGTSAYALTGSVLARDRRAIAEAADALRHAAGNFYVNDKPTGAVVGQQPFGGARASGTNDKAGSPWNLIRWASPRAIKETLVPPTEWRYPFMAPDENAG